MKKYSESDKLVYNFPIYHFNLHAYSTPSLRDIDLFYDVAEDTLDPSLVGLYFLC